MGQEVVVPQSFATAKPTQALAHLDPKRESLAEGIGQTYGVIGYKGKVWSLRIHGERYNFIRPDDGTPAAALNVIVLGKAKTKSKSLYAKYDPNASEGERPICASIDGITPDPDVTQKQSDSCAICPKNVWKTDPQTGRRGRECADYMRLAVLVVPNQTAPLLGSPLLQPVFLRVPPASLTSLAAMGEAMENQGWHMSTYVAQITFDPEKSWPEMKFTALVPLDEKGGAIVSKLVNDPTVGRITGGDIAIALPTAGASTTTAPSTAASAAPTPASNSAAKVSAPPATPATNAATPLAGQAPEETAPSPPVAASPPPPAPASKPTAPAPSTDIGFGGVTDVPQSAAAPATAAAPQAVADTGTVEETDDDMDATIASLLKSYRG